MYIIEEVLERSLYYPKDILRVYPYVYFGVIPSIGYVAIVSNRELNVYNLGVVGIHEYNKMPLYKADMYMRMGRRVNIAPVLKRYNFTLEKDIGWVLNTEYSKCQDSFL